MRGIADGQRAEAFANAAWVIDVEAATGTFFEPDLQVALLDHRWLIDVANFAYMNTHFVLTTGFLVWLYLYRNEHFYFVRNMFMVAMALALVGYALVPTAPPRLIEGYGFVDTINQYAQVTHDSALVKIFINPYAAIPSMHCAFALMIGATGALISKHTVTRGLLVRLSLLRALRRHRHGQPLLARRGDRLGWSPASRRWRPPSWPGCAPPPGRSAAAGDGLSKLPRGRRLFAAFAEPGADRRRVRDRAT